MGAIYAPDTVGPDGDPFCPSNVNFREPMMPKQDEWLMVIDMQTAFAEATSPWAAPGFSNILPEMQALIAKYSPNVVFTRFVAPDNPDGAWPTYYEKWPFALVPADDALYDIVPELTPGESHIITRTTFGKWDHELAELVGPDAHLVLTGVSTDCCVLSTALAAVDSGIAVTVVADACAGMSETDHLRAIEAMGLYAPLIRIANTSDLLDSSPQHRAPQETGAPPVS